MSPVQNPSENGHYVYIVECADGTYYTGWTNDLAGRIRQHNLGKGAKYTRGRIPVVLRYTEVFETKSEALRREREIKSYPRAKKIELIGRLSQSRALSLNETDSLGQ